MDHIPDRDLIDEIERRLHQKPGSRSLDRPTSHVSDSIEDDAQTGRTPPTADIDDRVPEAGMPGESETMTDDPYENEPGR